MTTTQFPFTFSFTFPTQFAPVDTLTGRGAVSAEVSCRYALAVTILGGGHITIWTKHPSLTAAKTRGHGSLHTMAVAQKKKHWWWQFW